MKGVAREALREALKEEIEDREESYGNVVAALTNCKCIHAGYVQNNVHVHAMKPLLCSVVVASVA